jgi:hypothetical protein
LQYDEEKGRFIFIIFSFSHFQGTEPVRTNWNPTIQY